MNHLVTLAAFVALFFIAASDPVEAPAPPAKPKVMIMISVTMTRNIGVEIDIDNPPTAEYWKEFADKVTPVLKDIEKIKPKLK